jgi:hypothetical protein
MEGICKTCGWSKGFTYPPSIGGKNDGIKCSNPAVAKLEQELGNEEALEMFEKNGYILLFRIEIISDSKCSEWKSQKEPK